MSHRPPHSFHEKAPESRNRRRRDAEATSPRPLPSDAPCPMPRSYRSTGVRAMLMTTPAFGVHSRRLPGVPFVHAARREVPKPVTLVPGEMKIRQRVCRVSVSAKTRVHCEASLILEPRLFRGDPHSRTALHESYSGLGSPIFGVTISTHRRGRLPTGHPVGRAHIPAEDGGRGRRRPGR